LESERESAENAGAQRGIGAYVALSKEMKYWETNFPASKHSTSDLVPSSEEHIDGQHLPKIAAIINRLFTIIYKRIRFRGIRFPQFAHTQEASPLLQLCKIEPIYH
jgi:hypothetical protein